MAISPNGAYAILEGTDYYLTIHNAETGASIMSLPFNVHTFFGFSPDSRRLAVTDWDGLRVYDLAKRELLWSGPAFGVTRFSPDGGKLFVAGHQQAVAAFTSNGQFLGRSPSYPNSWIESAALGPDGAVYALLSQTGAPPNSMTLRFIRTSNLTSIGDYPAGEAEWVFFSQDKRWVYVGDPNGSVIRFTVATGAKKTIYTNPSGISSMTLLPAKGMIVMGSQDGCLRSVSTSGVIQQERNWHGKITYLSGTPSGDSIFARAENGPFLQLDSTSLYGNRSLGLPSPIHPPEIIRYSFNGERIVIADWGSNVQVVDASTGSIIFHGDYFDATALGSRQIEAIATSSNEMYALSTSTGRIVVRRLLDDGIVLDKTVPFPPTHIVFDGSGDRLICAEGDGKLRVYSIWTGNLLQELAHNGLFSALGISKEGTRLVGADLYGYRRVWKVGANIVPLMRLDSNQTVAHSVDVNADATYAVFTSVNSIALYRLADGAKVGTISNVDGWSDSKFTADGNNLVTTPNSIASRDLVFRTIPDLTVVKIVRSQDLGFIDLAVSPKGDAIGTTRGGYGGMAVVGNPMLSSLVSLNPGLLAVAGGKSTTMTFTLSSPAMEATRVYFESSDPTIRLPGSVFVPVGSTGGTVTMRTDPTPVLKTPRIRATYKGVSVDYDMIVLHPEINSLKLSPTTINGGGSTTGTITLNTSAPVGGLAVRLTSNSPYASVPSTVVVPAGTTTVTFPITTSPVSEKIWAKVSARYLSSDKGTILTIVP